MHTPEDSGLERIPIGALVLPVEAADSWSTSAQGNPYSEALQDLAPVVLSGDWELSLLGKTHIKAEWSLSPAPSGLLARAPF